MRTINYSVSYEKLISRLPALFAFIETDEQGVTTIVKASEGKQGNYGNVVADFTCPSFDYTLISGDKIKITSGSHSYRTIIDAYYMSIKDMKEILSAKWEDKLKHADEERIPYPKFDEELNKMKNEYEFIKFVEKGIGLKYVGLSEETEKVCGGELDNKKIYPLAPDYIYLGEARTMYERVIKIEKQLSFWESHTKACKEDLKYYEALKREYTMMHGYDKDDETKRPLKEVLEKLILESENVAEEYYNYATQPPMINFNVNLVNTIKDLGLVTPYIQEWVGGKRYYHGDVVYHIDQYGYGMTWECNLKDVDDRSGIQKDELGREYINGQYDEETELIYFEDGNQTVFDGKTARVYWKPQYLNWVEENQKNGYVKGELPSTVKISGTVNSHLTSLRRFDTYMNRDEQSEIPDNYKDWLWYYRVGTIVNRETKYDEFGNMAIMYGNEVDDVIYANGIMAITGDGDGIYPQNGETVENLAVWGDVIESIVAENNNESGMGTITFTYWLGAHLKADKDYILDDNGNEILDANRNKMWYSIDDDGNYKYYFKNLRLDKDSKYGKNQGVKYTESYIYYQGNTDMEALIDFINGPKMKIGDRIYGHEVDSRYKSDEYLKGYTDDYNDEEKQIPIEYEVIKPFLNGPYISKGSKISYSDYKKLHKQSYEVGEDITEEMYNQLIEKNQKFYEKGKSTATFIDDNKIKCKPVEETIWTLVDRGVYENDGKNKTYFEKYINGEFDKGYEPEDVDDEDTNAPYYFKLYEKMEFDTSNNLYTYDIKIGNRMKEIPYFRTDYEANVDIRHVDVEKTPLIRYDYYNGVSFQPSINKDVNIERGITQAFEKHIKFSEIKTFEDLENYANGGFFVMSKEDINLG